MKRIIAFVIAVIMAASVLTACKSETLTVYKPGNNAAEASRADLLYPECNGSYDGIEAYTLKDNGAWKLFDYVRTLCVAENKTDSMEKSEHLIHMLFTAEWNKQRVDLGVYQIYDCGVISRSESSYSSNIELYTCPADAFDKIRDMVKK